MGGSSGPESSSPTLVGIRASIRCCSGFLSAARIRSLSEKNQNTSITAITTPRNITMVMNQIICALALKPTTVPSLLQEGPSTELNCTSVIGRSKITVARTRNGFVPASRRQLFDKLKPLVIPECPFVNLPEKKQSRWGQGLTADDMKDPGSRGQKRIQAGCETVQSSSSWYELY